MHAESQASGRTISPNEERPTQDVQEKMKPCNPRPRLENIVIWRPVAGGIRSQRMINLTFVILRYGSTIDSTIDLENFVESLFDSLLINRGSSDYFYLKQILIFLRK